MCLVRYRSSTSEHREQTHFTLARQLVSLSRDNVNFFTGMSCRCTTCDGPARVCKVEDADRYNLGADFHCSAGRNLCDQHKEKNGLLCFSSECSVIHADLTTSSRDEATTHLASNARSRVRLGRIAERFVDLLSSLISRQRNR